MKTGCAMDEPVRFRCPTCEGRGRVAGITIDPRLMLAPCSMAAGGWIRCPNCMGCGRLDVTETGVSTTARGLSPGGIAEDRFLA